MTESQVKVQFEQQGPRFTGLTNSGSLTARKWISSLEAGFQADGVTLDLDKIKKARNSITYAEGDVAICFNRAISIHFKT